MADPFCPALAAASEDVDPHKTLPLLDPNIPAPKIKYTDLPSCPLCKTGILRPDVVWFGENLDSDMLSGIDGWVDQGKIDLMLVIGTSALVSPANGFIHEAKQAGARVCVINIDVETKGPKHPAQAGEGDFVFAADAAVILPKLFEPIIGAMNEDETFARG